MVMGSGQKGWRWLGREEMSIDAPPVPGSEVTLLYPHSSTMSFLTLWAKFYVCIISDIYTFIFVDLA